MGQLVDALVPDGDKSKLKQELDKRGKDSSGNNARILKQRLEAVLRAEAQENLPEEAVLKFREQLGSLPRYRPTELNIVFQHFEKSGGEIVRAEEARPGVLAVFKDTYLDGVFRITLESTFNRAQITALAQGSHYKFLMENQEKWKDAARNAAQAALASAETGRDAAQAEAAEEKALREAAEARAWAAEERAAAGEAARLELVRMQDQPRVDRPPLRAARWRQGPGRSPAPSTQPHGPHERPQRPFREQARDEVQPQLQKTQVELHETQVKLAKALEQIEFKPEISNLNALLSVADKDKSQSNRIEQLQAQALQADKLKAVELKLAELKAERGEAEALRRTLAEERAAVAAASARAAAAATERDDLAAKLAKSENELAQVGAAPARPWGATA